MTAPAQPPTQPRGHRRHGERHQERTARRAARRTELLEAAVRAIRRDGPRVSMDAIAAEAGVTKPILYRHFGDRDGLATALADEFGSALVAELDDALAQDVPPDLLLRTAIDAYIGFVERDPNLYSFLVGRLGAPVASEVANGLVAQVGQRVAVVLGEQLRALGVDSGAAEPWAFGIVGMVHLAGDWWLERRTMTRARLVDELTRLLWNGLGGVGGLPGTPSADDKGDAR
jgi:AcrR family transcriptional regulator